MDRFDLNGRVAVVTGGASGIGRAISTCLAASRAQLWVLDITPAAEATAAEIAHAGGRAWGIPCDVADPESVSRVFATIASKGPIDMLINSADIAHIGTIATTNVQDFERIFRVNVQGTYLCMQAATDPRSAIRLCDHQPGIDGRGRRHLRLLRLLNEQGRGSRDERSRWQKTSWTRTFAAIASPSASTYSLRRWIPEAKIPRQGYEMMGELAKAQPIGRMARPDEVAGLALYLCSDLASFLTGAHLPFDGGVLNLYEVEPVASGVRIL